MTPEQAAQLFELARLPQFVLALTVVAGGVVLWIGGAGGRIVAGIAICCLALLALPFLITSAPLAPENTIATMLCVDVLIVAVLVGMTGGSELSCFGPVYFLIPTFGLLVFGPGLLVYLLCGVTAICFLVTLLEVFKDLFFNPWRDRLSQSSKIAYAILTAGCVAVAIFIDSKKTAQDAKNEQELASQVAELELPISYDEFEAQIRQSKQGETTDVGALRDRYNGKRVKWTVRSSDTSDSSLQGWIFVNFEGEAEAGFERTLHWFMLPISQWHALGRVRRDEKLFIDGVILVRDAPQLFPIAVTRSRP
jgi:hypothetical protein